MKSLYYLTIVFSLRLFANQAEDEYIRSINARKIEKHITESPQYKKCFEQLEDKNIATQADRDEKARVCVQNAINSEQTSKEDIEKVAHSLNIKDVDIKGTKTTKNLREYLTDRIYDAIHGAGASDKKKLKQLKYVDPKAFFDLYKHQIHRNIMTEFSRYCLENIGLKKGNQTSTYFFFPGSYISNDSQVQNKINNGAKDLTPNDWKKIKIGSGVSYKVASWDASNKNFKQEKFDSITSHAEIITSDSLKEFNFCSNMSSGDPANPCDIENGRDANLVNMLKDFELYNDQKNAANIGELLQTRFIKCSKVLVPQMCEIYRCRNIYDLSVTDGELGKKTLFCKNDLGISASDKSNKNGKIACNLVAKIQEYKKTLKAIDLKVANLDKDFTVKSGHSISSAYKDIYGMGKGRGEKKIDELTTISSKELVNNVKQYKKDGESAKELEARCLSNDGELNTTDPECLELSVSEEDIKNIRETSVQAQAQKAAYLKRVAQLKKNNDPEELKKFLLENDLGHYIDENGGFTIDEKELVGIIEKKYSADKQAIIDQMNAKLHSVIKKDSPEEVKKEVFKETLNEKKDTSKRVETLFNYTNIVTSYINFSNEENEQLKNSTSRSVEKKGFDEFAQNDEKEELEQYFNDEEQDSGGDGFSTESLINSIGEFGAAQE